MVKSRLLNKIILFILFYLAAISAVFAVSDQAGTSGSAFLKLGQSVRAEALGGSFVALADDASAIFYNPAGLQLSGYSRLSFTQNQWLVDSSYSTICYTYPLGIDNTMGFAASYLNFGSIQETTSNSRTGTGRYFTPSALLGVMSMAFNIQRAFVGINFKILQQNIDAYNENGYGIDVGMLTKAPWEDVRLGVSLLNLGVSGDRSMPLTLLAGLNYSLNSNTIILTDLRVPRDQDPSLHCGIEYKPNLNLAFRAGLSSLSAEGIGLNYSLGLGLKVKNFNVDYAYVPYSDLGDSHRVGVSVDY